MSFTVKSGDILVQDFVCSAESSKDKHAQMLVKPRGGAVYLKNVKFVADGYNGIEQESGVHLDSDLKVSKVVVEDCVFEGALANNAISFYNLANGCEITVRGCVFKSVSNALRISNNYAAKGVKVVMEDCKVEKGEAGAYRGLIIFQDYCSKAQGVAPASRNEFGDVEVEIKGCTYFDGALKSDSAKDDCSVAGGEHQLVYVYADGEGLITDAERLPKVSFR